jgi:flavin reductase (DIM6/NTAB) family NADH-FMN oxidoreductase RutF
MTRDSPSPLAQALGRVPTGLYVVAAPSPAGPVGFVASFVMQMGIDPPVLAVAVGRTRGPLAALRASGRFGVTVLYPGSKGVMGAFFKKRPSGESPFDELPVQPAPGGSPVLSQGLAWLECRITGEHETADHVVLFGEVESGGLLSEGDPSIHLRKDGLAY